ncbi:MAG: hypothetical protein AAF065_11750 [Verrucomicrobiota bacterium]
MNFIITSNNPSRLVVGSGSALTLQIDQPQGSTTESGQVYLPAGYHPITVEYYTEDISTMDLEIASQASGKNSRELPPAKLYFQDPSVNVIQGLYYESFLGDYGDVDLTTLDFDSMVPVETGLSNLIDLSYRPDGADDFIMWFSGLIDIPQQGEWTFYLSSGDACLIYINGSTSPLIYNAGTGYQYGSNTIELNAGLNEIEVVYYINDGSLILSLDYSTEGVSTQTVPASDLFVSPPNVSPGIHYEVYDVSLTEIDGVDFHEMTPVAKNNATEISANVPTGPGIDAQSDFALKFVGWVFLPTAGEWHFELASDGGSALYFDYSETPFILNDHIHGSVASKTSGIHLTRGFHRVEVHYFKNYSDGIGTKTLNLNYQGPWGGSTMEPINSALYTTDYIIGGIGNEQLLPYTVFY